jgi:hypothetical protein
VERPPTNYEQLTAASRETASEFVCKMIHQGVIDSSDVESISAAIRIAAELERVQLLMRAQRRRDGR